MPFYRLNEVFFNTFSHLCFILLEDVSINVRGNSRITMPKVLGNSLNVKSVIYHQTGITVSQRMNAEEMETVLRNEGYTIQCSNRPDDRILFDCFYYSFSRNYASALLKKDGYDGLEIGK